MHIRRDVMGIALTQGTLPGCVFGLLRTVEVISFESQLSVGPNSRNAIHLVESPIHEKLHASIADKSALQHHGGVQSSLKPQVYIHRVRTLNVLRLEDV